MQLITNIALVLRDWQNALRVKYSDIHIAYAESLNYAEGIVDIRSQNLVWEKDNPAFQALVYNRRPLKWATTHRAAKTGGYEYDAIGDIVKIYKSWYGEVELDFVFISPAPQYIDAFEIMYHIEDGISGIDEFTVDLTKTYDLGVWKYQCIWDTELKSLDIKYGDTYYKAITGSVKICGMYHIYTYDVGRIEQINFDIFSYNNVNIDNSILLEGDVIT